MSDTELDLGALRAQLGSMNFASDVAIGKRELAALLAAAGERAQLQARVAELERGEIKWAETCNDLRMTLDASSYVERHDAALKRAHAAEEQAAALQAEVERLRAALSGLLPLADWALLEQSPPGADDALVDAARAALAAQEARDARTPAQSDGGAT